jgi:hypothetical protein
MMACNEEKLIIARHFATKTAYKYCIGSAYDLKFNLRAGILDQMTTLLRQHHDYCQLTFWGRSPHNAKIPNSEEVDRIYVRVLDYSAPVRVFPLKPSRSTESTEKNRFYDVILILLVSYNLLLSLYTLYISDEE